MDVAYCRFVYSAAGPPRSRLDTTLARSPHEEFTCSTSWWKYVYDATGVSHVILCARKSVEQTGCGMAAKRTHTPAQKHGWMVYPQILALWRAYLHGKLLLQMQTVKTSFGLRGQVFAVCCGRPSTSHAVVFASHVVNTHPNHLRLVTLSTTYIFNSVSVVATVVAPVWLGFFTRHRIQISTSLSNSTAITL